MMHYDFMGKKYIWFSISAVIILIGLGSLAFRGLNYSIDFTSGSRLVIGFSRDTSVDEVREVAGKAGYTDAVVQTIGETRYQVTLPLLSAEEEDSVVSSFNDSIGVTEKSGDKVGATFGKQVRNSMIYAIIISWLIIIFYVSIRFEYKYSVATILALVHDLAITVGVYSLTGREVTTATVAAVLTILGYSLYDTIIVFDRVRENSPKARRGTYAEMVNISIWEVMARSIITTLLTVTPVICLLLFGGQTLKDFAFALLVGILSGAFSSIFVAAPVLCLWKEHEPKYRGTAKDGNPGKGGVKAAKAR